MPISVYADIRTAVWDLLDIDVNAMSTAKVDVLIASAEDNIYRELRLRFMESVVSSTITASGSIATPSQYVELKSAYIDGNPVVPLERKSAEWINSNYPKRASDGKPVKIAREGSNFIFGPYPDASYVVRLLYYAKPATQVGTSATLTGVLAASPYLLVFKAAAEIDPVLGRDIRVPLWENKYRELKEKIRLEEEHEDWSGSPLAMTAG